MLAIIFCCMARGELYGQTSNDAREQERSEATALEGYYHTAKNAALRLVDAVKEGVEDAEYGETPSEHDSAREDDAKERVDPASYRYEQQALEAARATAKHATNLYRKLQSEETPLTTALEGSAPETLDSIRSILRLALGKLADSPIYFEVFLYFACVAILSTALTLVVRTLYGASPIYLVRSAFYEIPQLRGALYTLVFFAYAVAVVAAFYGACYAIRYFSDRATIILVTAIAYLVAAAIIYLLARKFKNLIDDPYPYTQFAAKKAIVKFKYGVKRSALRKLGRESFPEMLEYGLSGGVGFRRLVLALQLGGGIAFVLICTDLTRQYDWLDTIYKCYASSVFYLLKILPIMQPALAIAVTIVSSIAILVILTTDQHYLVLRFSRAVLLDVVLGASILVGVKSVVLQRGFGLEKAYNVCLLCFAVLNLAIFIRWFKDLRRAKRFRRRRALNSPIISDLRRTFKFLVKAQKDKTECELTPLDRDRIAERVANGLYNVEAESFTALRNMIRFLGRIRAEYERFVGAQLEALVVTRELDARSLGGINCAPFSRYVPIWDETLFPLYPPSGYRDHTDRAWLNSEWNFVAICSGCGGSGYNTVTRTEYRTREVSDGAGGYRTESYTVEYQERQTCGACSGCGRIEYQQAIVTVWTRHCASAIEPETRLPEYMDDAPERTYYERAFLEDQSAASSTREPDQGASAKFLEQARDAAARFVANYADAHVKRIAKDYQGKVYRARVRVVAFWTIRIVFRRIFGKFGWFFGKRPDFYFKMIPLSWSAVVAACVVAPFALACAVCALVAIWRYAPYWTACLWR